MKLTFLGDAYDHWKGALFESLQHGAILRDFAVDPMVSEINPWEPADLALFSKLLKVERSQLVSHQAGLSDRQRYFAEISHAGDLFLDPDTGIATRGVKNLRQYVKPSEIRKCSGSAGTGVEAFPFCVEFRPFGAGIFKA